MTDAAKFKEPKKRNQTGNDRRRFLQAASIGSIAAAGSIFPATSLAQAKTVTSRTNKPNIVFILTDNLGYGEVGCYGGGITRGAATPRIPSPLVVLQTD